MTSQILLLFDGMIVTRYIFIFWIKNPSRFQDNFWNFFINLWVLGFSFVYQFSWTFLPGCQPVNYYFCTGEDPNLPFQQQPQKSGGAFELLSLLLFSVTQFRIYWRNRQTQNGPLTFNEHLKNLAIAEIDSNSFSNISTNIFGIFICSLGIILGAILSNVSLQEMVSFPYYLIFYFTFLLLPSTCLLSVPIMYILKHEDLRKTIYQKMCLKNQIIPIND
jgi:hypothetical protein